MASENLRDLVVSLSLDSSNFARNLRSINAQIKEAESTFRLAGAGIDNFGDTVEGAGAKLANVKRKYELQGKAVEQYARQLAAAEERLQKSKQINDKYALSLSDAKKRLEESTAAMKDARKEAQAAAREKGEDSDEAKAAAERYARLAKEQKEAGDAYKKLRGQTAAASRTMQNNADAVTKAQTAYNNGAARLKELRRELERLEDPAYKAGKSLEKIGGAVTTLGRGISTVGRGMTRYITAPIAALGATAVKSSIDFESAFVQVRKTVEATETQYNELATAITHMSTEVAAGADEIAAVVATAGQLGIANNQIMQFSRTIQDLSVSTEDLKGTDAAAQLAKFANIVQMDQSQFGNLGSALVELGNNYATTEGAIMSMALNLAAAGKQVGMSASEILGFAAGLSSVGIEAERGGSAFSKAIKNMEVAAVEGGEALSDFARVAGMTDEQFRSLWQSDPSAAFTAFIAGLAQMDEEGISTIKVLNDIGMTEVRLSDTMLRAANASELFASAVDSANDAWADNTALTKEADKFYGTTESKLKNLKNRASNYARTLGDSLNPQIQSLIGLGNDLLAGLEKLDAGQVRAITRGLSVAALIGPVAVGAGKLVKATGDATTGIGKLLKSFADLKAKSADTGKSLTSLITATTSFKAGMVTLGVALAAGAVALAYYTSDAYKAKKAIEELGDTANDWASAQADTLYGGQGLAYFGLSAENITSGAADSIKSMEQWRDGLIAVWTDGQKETNEIVASWTESFTALTDETRQKLRELREATGGDESVTAGAIDADMARLDALDTEIAALIKRRQNGLFTDDDMVNLQAAVNEYGAITVKYQLAEETPQGYDGIKDKIQGEFNRAQAENRSVNQEVYDEGTLAAAQVYAEMTRQLEEQYDLQRKILEGSDDQTALDALDADYIEKRARAAKDYLDALANTAAPILSSEETQKAKADMDELVRLLSAYSASSTEGGRADALAAINEHVADMDKDAIVEYIALLDQIKAAGGEAEYTDSTLANMFGGDWTGALEALAAIDGYLTQIDNTDLSALQDMFAGIIPDELETINAQLNRDDLAKQWAEFAVDPGAYIETGIVMRPTGMDAAALEAWQRNNPVEITAQVTLGSVYDNPEDAVNDQAARFFDSQGVQIVAQYVPADKLTEDTLVLLTESANGVITRNIIVNVKQPGEYDPGEMLDELKDPGEVDGLLAVNNGRMDDTMSKLKRAIGMVQDFNAAVEKGGIHKLFTNTDPAAANQAMLGTLDEGRVGQLAEYVADLYARLQQGKEITEEEREALGSIVTLLTELGKAGYGAYIITGIQAEMEAVGWEGTAETLAGDLQKMLEQDIGDKAMGAVGRDAMQALAASITNNSGPAIRAAQRVGQQIAAALNPTRPGSTSLSPGGTNGNASVSSVMGRAGAAMMESVTMGALKAVPEQSRILNNAARYLTVSAGRAVTSAGAAARNTYHNEQTVSVTGNTFSIRSDQDIQALAYEITSLMRRRQRGYGA